MKVIASGVQIEVDVQGPEHGEPVLLIMGLAMQLTGWPDELVQLLVQRGFRVIRHDNRDAGLSEDFDRLGTPNVMVQAVRHRLRLPVRAPYRLADMAADALGVLDTLGIAQAHICGASMGGMIAQHIAANQPQRVKSLTLIMTSSGARGLRAPHPRIVRLLLSAMDELARERGWARTLVAGDQFFAWIPQEPLVRISPDVYLLDDPPAPPYPAMWRTWLAGQAAPRFAVEVVSDDWAKDYLLAPRKYAQLGTRELVV